MSEEGARRRDVVLLVADTDMRFAFQALLHRHESLGIRPIAFDIAKHNDRDAGCFAAAHDYLRPLAEDYDRALVVFDRHGCGSAEPAAAIEADVRQRVEQAGWAGRCDAVVLDPELEVWVWSPSPKVAECLGWPPDATPLRQWLEERGLWEPSAMKPTDPKAALEQVRREVRKRRSPRLYELLARSVTTRGCADPSFNRFRQILRRWFPPP